MPETHLTTEEQIRLVNGASFFGTAEIPEKEIPRLQLLDGGTGINFEQLFGDFLSSRGRMRLLTAFAERSIPLANCRYFAPS